MMKKYPDGGLRPLPGKYRLEVITIGEDGYPVSYYNLRPLKKA